MKNNAEKNRGSWLRQYGFHLVITLALLLVVAGIPFSSYYQRQFWAKELEIVEEAAHAVKLTEEEEPVLLVDPEYAYAGTVGRTGNITLQKGRYILQIVALSESEGNGVEIYSPGKLNADNTQGVLLTSEPLRTGGEVTEISFAVEDSMEDISIRFVYGGTGGLNVSGFYLASAQRMYYDIFVLMGAVCLVSLLILLGRMRGKQLEREDRQAFLVLTAAVALTSLPLAFDFVLDGNDLYYQFNRILGIQEGLKSGQFPVKIHSTMLHGYGYGSSIFYPELFLYLPAFFGCMGVSLIGCYRIWIVLVNMATAFVSYRSFSGMTRSKGIGLMASLLYTLSIYRLIDLYTRAAVGEAMAMIFLPLVMWGMYELFLGKTGKWYLAVLGFTGIMQSHVLSVELAVFFGSLFAVCHLGRLREKGRLQALLLAAFGTVLLNLSTLIRLVHHATYPFRVFSVESTLSWWTTTLPKLFDFILANPTQRLYANLQNSGEMPCSLGFVLLVGILAFLYCCLREEKKDSLFKSSQFALGLAVIGIYLSTNLFPWDKIQNIPILYRLATSIQIPIRFLAFSSVFLCLVCAVGFWRLSAEKEVRKVICAGAGALAFLCAGVYVNRYCEEAAPRYTFVNQYQREQAQVDVLYFMNVDHANSFRIWNRENTFAVSRNVKVAECSRGEDLTAGFVYEAGEDSRQEGNPWVDVSFTYYPNYRAYAEDGTRLQTGVGDQGVLRVYLPEAASGRVEVCYQEPWYYLAGRLVSLGAFLLLLFLLAVKRKKKLSV